MRRTNHKTLREKFPQYAIGRGSYGNLTLRKYGSDRTLKIGAFTSIADGVTVMLGGEHRPDWVTTFPFNILWPEAGQLLGHPRSKGDVVIGNDVWIGLEALICSGVEIGDGAVIGARAVVTRDVPPYAIVAGNPGRVVRYRFSQDIIEALLRIRWWDWPDEKITLEMRGLLNEDVEGFIKKNRVGQS